MYKDWCDKNMEIISKKVLFFFETFFKCFKNNTTYVFTKTFQLPLNTMIRNDDRHQRYAIEMLIRPHGNFLKL